MPDIQSSLAVLALWAAVGYLLGSIPFGMIVARVLGLGNLRNIGSGNIGATNVLRTGNKLGALITLLLDGGKGAAAVLLARALAGEDAAQLAGLAAFTGHCYPIWLSFRGGKGVATFLGIFLGLAWPVGIACCLTWLVAAVGMRISSMAAIYMAALSTVWMVFLGYRELFVLGIILTLFIFLRHAANIRRLRDGTEPKIGQK
ncbi:glycerol-3-phosphate 1-O-acyltransferase PlsY [Roseovarius atlanticus]|uniref:glycerol-3-phosphate 1-O-acyltransferase PlsY n=1 Tax=Roseovarius atlanticus TaxID=1641875 RepID=UPI001C9510B5|nr:glycerol-3-phosphate 1-O-acyltransferase PlsY [Roseovarius atlanticus]MBY5986531.1 glycerol-3-phosphate 1-O-acyltransferase PlsY [Roseovarius atlanticus]MBY6125171.1 glycerol-3-phosphate 1-O-acyltransferase PlsY [Roseovarius atlanticus]MBY6150368.1 glycerol-3-phosphate 1-O-acyltransferase PlsY [Roseovarius atlanticus]